MNIDDIIYLNNVLDSEEAKKYLKADEDRFKMLIDILKKTSIKRLLSKDMLKEFCNKIVYAKYGKIYGEVLCDIGKFNKNAVRPIEYSLFLANYIKNGYNDEVAYKELFNLLNSFVTFLPFNNYSNYLNELVEKEIEDANEEKMLVDEFIQMGGSLENLIEAMEKQGIKEFNRNTKISKALSKSIKTEKYEVSICQIGYLVSLMSSFDLGKKTQIELLEVYYSGLQQSKQNGFATDVLVVENKPRLYKLLKDKGLVANIIENEQKEAIKQLEKKK